MGYKEGYIICEDSNKNVVLKNHMSELLNYTFLSLEQLIETLTFSVSKEAITYLTINKNIEPKIAKMYVDKLKYESLFFDNVKLNYLKELKNELEEKGFITYDELFINYLKNTPVTFVGYLETKELRFCLNLLDKNNIKYELHNFEEQTNKKRTVYGFRNIAEEARFVFNRIKELLDSGISIDKIKIANYSDEYEYDFKRLSSYYKIPINFNAHKNILSTPIAHRLFELLDLNLLFDEIIAKLKESFSTSPYLKKIINVINSYKLYHYEAKLTKSIFKYELSKMTFNKITYENAIELIDIETYASQIDEHIFLIGFNLGACPKIYKDIDYFDDNLRNKLGLDTSNDLNLYAKEDLLRSLNRNTNIYISYKLKSSTANFIPSYLIKELEYEEIKDINYQFGLNEEEDNVVYAISLDEYNKFGTIQNEFNKSIYDINYLKYDNKFNGIDPKKLNEHLEVIKLSYSSLNNYYECPFKYYLKNVLNVSLITKNTSADFGTYTHEILEKSYDADFDFERVSNKALNHIKENLNKNNLDLTDRDLFFMELFKNLAKRVLEFNQKYEANTEFSDVLTEPKLIVRLDNGKLIFEGKVDKILYNKKEDRTIFAVVDYKTGNNIDIDLSNLDDGMHTQLPIYYYLVKNSECVTNDFNNPDLIGLYYHKISLKDDNLKLSGYTKDGMANIDIVDREHTGEYIDKINKLKSGMKNNRPLSIDDINYFDELVVKLLNDAYTSIRNAKFNINPKQAKKINACSYCDMKDICYKKYEDIIKLEDKPFKKKEDNKDGI